MGMNFPNSPLPGQVYTPVGGYSYVFLDGVWRIVQPAQAYVPTADTRNRIVNSAMQISQENGTAILTANNAYPADQWTLNYGGGFAGVVQARQAMIAGPNSKSTRLVNLVATIDASMTASKFWVVYQRIEGINIKDFGWPVNPLNGAVLTFDFKSSIAGTFTAGVRSGVGPDASWLKAFTVTAEEVGKIVTRTFAVPAPSIGTWPIDNTAGLIVHICFAAGPSITGVEGWQAGNLVAAPGQTNGAASTSNQFEFMNVGLYLDPDNTGVAPRWQMPDEAEELRACQRYWQTSYPPGAYPGSAYGAGGIAFQTAGTSTLGSMATRPFQTTMRISPAMTSYSGSTGASGVLRSLSNGTDVAISGFAATPTGTGAVTFSAVPTATYQYQCQFVANARM